MNHKLVPIVSAFLILMIVLGTTPLTYAAVTYTIGPKLEVVTIPEDDQIREKGIIILGLTPTHPNIFDNVNWRGEIPTDLESQHKLIVTYNGAPLTWTPGCTGPGCTQVIPVVTCNVLEKDKVNVVRDPKTGKGKQGDWENLMTTLIDVSSRFVCKPRWKSPAGAPTLLESVGVLDVYWKGSLEANINPAAFIADHILIVNVYITIGRTQVWGTDMQDICVLGWAFQPHGWTIMDPFDQATEPVAITKPDGSRHYIWVDPLGAWAGCEEAALTQRARLGLLPNAAADPLSKV